MRYRVTIRDVPAEAAARRLGLTLARFNELLPRLLARHFPKQDPDTGLFDLQAIDRWCDARHGYLFAEPASVGARDAGTIANERIAAMRGGSR